MNICRSQGIPAYWVYLEMPANEATTEERERVMRIAQQADFAGVFDLHSVYEGYELSALQVAPWDFTRTRRRIA